MPKTLIALLASLAISGCVAVPRVEIQETLSFDYEMPDQTPMSYNDLLCCYQCHA